VPLLQDQRSIMLANEGYFVVEVAYNAPQYGLESMWMHHLFKVEYFEKIIHKALAHPRSTGSTVAVIGHSKGSEMATIISQTLHDLVDLTFTSGGPYFAFFHEFSYRGEIVCDPILEIDYTADGSWEMDEKGVIKTVGGMYRITMIDEMLLFNRHDEINLEALKVIKEKKRYKMNKIKKHFNFQTLEDPIMSPSAEMTKFMTEYLTADTDINVEFYECGHLCTVPHLPMVDKSFMMIGSGKMMMSWGTCATDEEKIRDAKEIERMYSDLVSLLRSHF